MKNILRVIYNRNNSKKGIDRLCRLLPKGGWVLNKRKGELVELNVEGHSCKLGNGETVIDLDDYNKIVNIMNDYNLDKKLDLIDSMKDSLTSVGVPKDLVDNYLEHVMKTAI